jgi:5-formyltetrahydrofolate cyclo-ligase
MGATTVSHEKARLRAAMQRRLAALDPAEAQASARAATARLLALPEIAEARSLLVCLSFGDELDTGELVERWLASGRALFVPRAVRASRELEVCAFPCELETLSFGLRQPPSGVAALPVAEVVATVGAVVVLGLAFDLRGYRLGHGAGYFDRFLARHRALPAIGLAHDLQVVERLPVEPHDVAMRVVVTGSRVLRCVQPGPAAVSAARETRSDRARGS